MKVEVPNPSSPLVPLEKSPKPSPSSSALARLCRKLSPKRASSSSDNHQKRTLSCVTAKLPVSDMERLFLYFDEDGDGKVSPVELQSCVRAVGGELSVREAESVVLGLDSDGDGLLGLDDFTKLIEPNGANGGHEEELREAFGMYEMEGSGCITPKSLKRMLSRLGESRTIQECKNMIRTFDINGDGVLSFDEFRVMMR